MKISKEPLTGLVLILFSVLIALTIAEIICRSFNLSKTWSSYRDSEKVTAHLENSRSVGFHRIPDISFIAERDVTYFTNDLGFRERSFNKTTKITTKRVAYLGDSVTEGFGVEKKDRYTDKVEENLKNQGLNYESLNFAVVGHATIDEYEILKKYVLDYSPQYVIVQICFNDFQRNEYMSENHVNTPINNIDKNRSFSFKYFLQKNSALYLFAAEKYNYQKLQHNIANDLLPTQSSITSSEWKWTVYYLDAIKELCSKNNIKLIITYIPLEVEVIMQNADLANLTTNKIKEYCTNQSVQFLNVTEKLRSYNNRSSLFLDDCHLSLDGNRIIADAITVLFLNK